MSEAVLRGRALIHERVADPEFDLAQLARAVHVSPPHLVRRFGAELGTTPIAYLWERRVALAIDLRGAPAYP